MLSEFSSSFSNLSSEQREALSDLLKSRNAYTEQVIKLNQLKIHVLSNPTSEAEAHLREAALAMAPQRADMSAKQTQLLMQTVDLDGLKPMLPMLLAVLAQYVNVPLMMNAIGLEPDVIEEAVGHVKQYFQSDLG